MPRKQYEAEYVSDECLIHDGLVFKVRGKDAFYVEMRVIGTVRINGKLYSHNDVLSLPFTPEPDEDALETPYDET